jgi:hypothetical protein
MKRNKIFVFLLMAFMIGALVSKVNPVQTGANLYKVYIRSQADADAVANLGVNAICRVVDGYLIHTVPDMEPNLRKAGIEYELVAVNTIRDRLAVGGGNERFQMPDFPVIYEESGLRLYSVDPEAFRQPTWKSGIAPLLSDRVPITFRKSPQFDLTNTRDMVDLDSLASCVLLDSCTSYVHRLQDFQNRWGGTDSNYASRDWLIEKFSDFGYDSITTDTFIANNHYDALDLVTCHSVFAYKIGTEYPDHHIVIGAHRDSSPIESPGADDNASGTSGVLEIARVLSGLDTKMTIVFALFDAEETGLFGSWHYANRAVRNGDSIVLMINMDIIGYYENNDTAMVGYAPWCTYGDLWADLADSLPSINLNTDLYPEAFWDGEPFQYNGYDAITACENIINPYLHGAHDSTSYLNFDYMTRIVRGCLVTAYVTDYTYVPAPMLQLSYPNGTPDYINPNSPALFEVLIDGYADGIIAPGTENLNYAMDGGSWETAPLANIGGGLYQATLPPLPCNSHISFYVSAEESGGVNCYSINPEEPHMIATGLEATVVAEFDFEDYFGWASYGSANQGHWSPWRPRGRGEVGRVPIDHDGSGWCYVTGPEPKPWIVDDNFDVDEGTASLKSPSIDMTGGQVLVEYARWFSNHTGAAPYSDIFEVYISNDDGSNWTIVETVGPVVQSSGGWFVHRFWVNDIIEPGATMRLRFDASDDGDDSRVEGGIDAVTVTLFSCGTQPEIITETIGDWTEDYPLSLQLESTGGYGNITWTDTYDDLTGTGFVLESDGLLHGTSYDVGPISFTATITDGFDQTDQQVYSFTLNPALYIVTESLPRGMVGNTYSYQLTSDGGTGDITWIDVDDSLAASGLTLSPDGLISGTPLVERWRYFTIRATDEVDAFDEKVFHLHITSFYICGDANGDGSCNVGDAVFIIMYVFKGGPVPEPIESGDANGDGSCNIGDTVYIINYVFSGGPPPEC